MLPTVLTIAILVWAYRFVQQTIAEPINVGIREAVVRLTPWPPATELDIREYERNAAPAMIKAWQASGNYEQIRELGARRVELEEKWRRYAFPLDLIGLLVAVTLIYLAGGVLGSFIGRRLYKRGETVLRRLPLIRYVYPSVKQVTDFFFGDAQDRMQFNRVVAVQYPRKGLWSVGLMTGDTMRDIEGKAGEPCVTVFVPSSPTPFTGYVITVPRADTVDLPISIEDAFRFCISGGVIVPESQRLDSEAPPVEPVPPELPPELPPSQP